MPYLTMREKSKATTKPWFSRLLRHPARKWSGCILGQKTTLTAFTNFFGRLLTYDIAGTRRRARQTLLFRSRPLTV